MYKIEQLKEKNGTIIASKAIDYTKTTHTNIAIIIHVFYIDIWKEML